MVFFFEKVRCKIYKRVSLFRSKRKNSFEFDDEKRIDGEGEGGVKKVGQNEKNVFKQATLVCRMVALENINNEKYWVLYLFFKKLVAAEKNLTKYIEA